MFVAVPLTLPLYDGSISVELMLYSVCKNTVLFDNDLWESNQDSTQNDDGTPLLNNIVLTTKMIAVTLVHGKCVTTTNIGYQIMVLGRHQPTNQQPATWLAIVANRVYHPFTLDGYKMKDIEVKHEQLSGNLANDGKQIRLLDGKNGCLVQCPMSCCMVTRGKYRGRTITDTGAQNCL